MLLDPSLYLFVFPPDRKALIEWDFIEVYKPSLDGGLFLRAVVDDGS